MLKGKWAYVAPEQVRGQTVDRRADLFGAAITVFHLATLQSPFSRNNEAATLRAVDHDPLPSLAALRPDLPPAVAEAIDRAARKEPAARFATPREFRDALPAPSPH